MNGLAFGLLGPLLAHRDGVPLALGPRGRRSALAVLLIHANEPVAPDRVADELETTRGTVQVYVSRLRAVLGAATITTEPAGYVFRADPDRIDARRFERLVTEARRAPTVERPGLLADALALWRGPALADLACERFARAEVARLEELRLGALENRAAVELELGRHAAVVPELAYLVVEHPFRERLRALLMTALYRLGRQADALAVYRDARRRLAEELGLQPTPALRDLERAILNQELAG